MKHKHSHDCGICQHECLHYCKCCGKVYCCKCGQEWGDSIWRYQPYTIWISPAIKYGTATYTIDNTVALDATTDTMKCCHSH